MPDNVVLLSIPGLRGSDLDSMPRLTELTQNGDRADLAATFPAVTCPVQANMTTGAPPSEHGVVANGFFHRDGNVLDMWTAPNECIARPQLWDILHTQDASITSAVWFPLHSKHCGADYVCTPAPIHNPDGAESMWCYTKPDGYYDELLEQFDQFPLHHFWGPLSNIKATEWICSSAIQAAEKFRPNFFYIYLPHLDYAAQKNGPDSPEAKQAVVDLDVQIGRLVDGFHAAYDAELLWLAASEYVITPVDDVIYPNRLLSDAGMLATHETDQGVEIDFARSDAWALVDHQFSHVFVRDGDATLKKRVAEILAAQGSVAEVFDPRTEPRFDLNHANSGDLIAVSAPNSWQAYYWWEDGAKAPKYARTVDIHRKPGYDPVEMHFDPATKGIPLDATRTRGSHGAPTDDASRRGVLLSSQTGVFVEVPTADTDVADIVLRQFGI